jgi:hypothetical protein
MTIERLTDEQIAELRDDMKPGFHVKPWDIPPPETIHALATEVLESRAEIAKLRKALSVWEDAFATGRLGLAALRALHGRDET